jgi:hypothetical protein
LILFRPNKVREFIEYTIPESISLIRRISSNLKYEKIFYRTQEEIKQAEVRYANDLKVEVQRKEEQKIERERQEGILREKKIVIDIEIQRSINSDLSSTEL